MKLFANSEERQRIKFASTTQEQVLETLQLESVVTALGEYATQLTRITESLYVPNIKDNCVSIPLSHRGSDSTPFVPIKPGEIMEYEPYIWQMAPRQRKAVEAATKRWELEKGINISGTDIVRYVNHAITQGKERNRDLGIVSLAPNLFGRTFYSQANNVAVQSNDNSEKVVNHYIGRPIVSIVMASRPQGAHNVTLIHELEHVDQNLRAPVYPAEDKEYKEKYLRKEIEACFVSYTYEEALWHGGLKLKKFRGVQNDAQPEGARRALADESDPFFPWPTLVKRLIDLGVTSE